MKAQTSKIIKNILGWTMVAYALFSIIIGILIATGFMPYFNDDYEDKIVNCYDRNYNKIIGAECIRTKEDARIDEIGASVVIIWVGAMVLGAGIAIVNLRWFD